MEYENLTIRPATADDVERLAKVAWQSFHEAFADHPANRPEDMKAYMDQAFAPETIRNEIADAENIYIVAETGGTLAGYAKLRIDSREDCISAESPVELCRLYCLEEHIGKGIGRRLMHECLAIAEAEGRDVMWLGVWEFNERAQNFYTKAGFEKCGTHVFLLGSDPQTDWVMQRRVS
jgi:ribosomal protein S18 acetylase RimI-like enzyme